MECRTGLVDDLALRRMDYLYAGCTASGLSVASTSDEGDSQLTPHDFTSIARWLGEEE